jgi:hypothetical protein
MPAFFVSDPQAKNNFFCSQVRAFQVAKAGRVPSKTLPHEKFLIYEHKVFWNRYVTCINSGLIVTEQRDRPS